jgi:hypothetical protein
MAYSFSESENCPIADFQAAYLAFLHAMRSGDGVGEARRRYCEAEMIKRRSGWRLQPHD